MKRWVQGQPFHPYGRRSWDCLDGETVAEAVERCRDIPARLEFTGELLSYRSTVEFWITYQQTGDPGGSGFSGPWSSIEDACYASLTMIEEHEREVYEQTLIVGLA